jgi:F-type H+-transporting ATPase subunit delta
VDSITVPGAEGDFTVTNNHSLLVSLLRPGRITVRSGAEEDHYFVSDGFVFFNHPKDDSGCCECDISGIEIVPQEMLDKERTQQVMANLGQSAGESDWDKTRVQLGTHLCATILKQV